METINSVKQLLKYCEKEDTEVIRNIEGEEGLIYLANGDILIDKLPNYE